MNPKHNLIVLAALALILILAAGPVVNAAPADDLVITGLIDGPLTGGIPKAVELYAANEIPDLSIYGIGLANNGGGSDGIEFTFPADSVPAGSCIYVATDAVSFNAFFGFDPSYTDGDATANNGDDAFELFTNGSVTDVFGDINTDGTGQAWEYLDGWAYRNSGTGPDGSTFVLGNWSFSGINALDGETTNATAAVPFPLGTYSSCTIFTPPPPPPPPPSTTLIHDVQGNGSASPLVGSTVTIEGIVVGDFQDDLGANGDLNGFFVQEEDADADADPATSEGIFVFQGSNPTFDIVIGDRVRVEGAVSEFNGLTEITSFSGVSVIDSGNPLPTVSILSLPVTDVGDFEAYEGMYVTFPQALFISEYFNFDRFGEIVLTSERQFQPTASYEPGSAEAADLAAANALSRITLDDGRTSQNPDPAIHPNGSEFNLNNLFRGGDTVANVTGVINYNFGLYRVQPTQGAVYTNANPRPEMPDEVGGNLKVASFNVLNYFTSIDFIQDSSSNNDPADDICGPLADQECRGADNDEEFTRQRDKIIAAISAIDADVVGLIEIENHPGDVPTADLVSGLNDVMGAGTYEYIATGAIGTDAIRQAFIYKPASVSLVGDYAVLDDASFTDPLGYGEEKSRPALAQTFMDNDTGGVFTAVVNHLKSKGSSCGPGDDDPEQASCNLTRTLGAQALVEWLATDPTGSGDEDFLIIGDLNAYDKEDPIDALIAGGYADLVKQYQGENAYSYVFDGQLGYLDHALANGGLMDKVTGTTVWHINADEPDLIDYDTSFKQAAQDAIYAPDAYRSSDHDPVIVGLELTTEQEVYEMMRQVQAYVDDGTLNGGQGNALTSKLENVLAKLERGNSSAAVNQLGAFINQLEDYVSEGVLTAEQAEPLSKAALAIVFALSE